MTSSSTHGYYCINVGGSGAAYVSAVRRRGASMCPLSSDYIYIGNYRELCRAGCRLQPRPRNPRAAIHTNPLAMQVVHPFGSRCLLAQTHEYARHTTAAA